MFASSHASDFRRYFFGIQFSPLNDVEELIQLIDSVDIATMDTFRYVVTPNADHIVRLVKQPALRNVYNNAWLCLNDSRVVQLLLRLGGLYLPVIRGSDLVEKLFKSRCIHGQRLIILGGDHRVDHWLKTFRGSVTVFHYNPPMGFIRSAEAIERVIEFIAQHLPAIICLAVGSPGQEIVADMCVQRGLRGGIALCVGAGILMAAGIEKRAPAAVRFVGLEWLYRLTQDPIRLTRRYLRDLRILMIVGKEILWQRLLPIRKL